MAIRIPDHEIGGTWAMGVRVSHGAEIVTLDFLVEDGPGDYLVVQRIRLTPSALEPTYLELGALLQQRGEAQG